MFHFSLQLRQYVPDDRVIGHSANIAELDVESDDDEEYILVSLIAFWRRFCF